MTRPWKFGRGNTATKELTGTHGRWEVLAPAMSLGSGARFKCRCTDCGHELSARATDIKRERVGCPGCREAQRSAVA